jgi:voltage-gated potassium channel
MVQFRSHRQKELYGIIFEAETSPGKRFDLGLIAVILASVFTVMLDSVASLSSRYAEIFIALEWLFTLAFTIEYGLRIYAAPKPWAYIRSFYGIIDLLAILPTYVSLIMPGSRYFVIIRLLRVLRIFRVLKLMKFVAEASYLRSALIASRRKILVFLFSVLTLASVVGSLMYVIEGAENGFTSIPRSIYWAIVTLTTVGYGDISPATPLGQLLAAFIMILGYGIIAVPTGIVTLEMANLERRPKLLTEVCPNCHAEEHDADAHFCKICGHKL